MPHTEMVEEGPVPFCALPANHITRSEDKCSHHAGVAHRCFFLPARCPPADPCAVRIP